jgi:hypothetical protein
MFILLRLCFSNQSKGILFRIDASASFGNQSTPITHSYANGTAPHADSRHMIFSPSGVLLEADDGGIWARSEPTSNQGRWSALHGDLAITETHSAALGWVSHLAPLHLFGITLTVEEDLTTWLPPPTSPSNLASILCPVCLPVLDPSNMPFFVELN